MDIIKKNIIDFVNSKPEKFVSTRIFVIKIGYKYVHLCNIEKNDKFVLEFCDFVYMYMSHLI